MLKNLLLVGVGGALGSMLRYAVGLLLPRAERGFPWGTLTVNLAGCLLIGILAGLAPRNSWLAGSGWLLLATGVCGGFTTFSALALDSVKLMQSGGGVTAAAYVASSLVLGTLICYLGMMLVGTPGTP